MSKHKSEDYKISAVKYYLNNNVSIFVTSTLSVSRNEYLACKEMAEFLSKCNIITSISDNLSTTPKLENGCRLT